MLRCIVFLQVDLDRHGRIPQLQVRGLVLFVVRAREVHRRHLVEGELAVVFGIGDGAAVAGLSECVVVGMVVQRPRRAPAQHVGVQSTISEGGIQSPVKGRSDVAYAIELVPHPALLEASRVVAELGVAARTQGVECSLGRAHARLHGRVRPLDLCHVQEPGAVADQGPARERQFGNGLQSAFA